MAVNKVDFGGNTLIDLTGDTLESAEQLLKGIIAHAKDGSVITGLMEAGGGGGGGEIDFSPFKSIIYGTYTPVEDVNSFSVPNPNNISGKNAFFVISKKSGTIGSNGVDSAVFQSMWNQISRLRYSSSSFTNSYPRTVGFLNFGFGSYYLVAGVTYWYAFGVE